MRHATCKALASVLAVLALACASGARHGSVRDVAVNDVHAQLNETRVDRILRPDSVEAVQAAIRQARVEGRAVSISGGRHAMGGQQFGAGTILLDMRGMDRVLGLDERTGHLEVEAGILWPKLIAEVERHQHGRPHPWGIRQKQTGADQMSIGGALSANVHGRGLRFKPFVEDVESFRLVDAQARVLTCSRTENPELFRVAIGGYGLFGVITSVKLRLVPRQRIERVVRVITLEELVPAIEKNIVDGYLYGDFQFEIDPASEHFLTRGVFSCYRPADATAATAEGRRKVRFEDWSELLYLAHADKSRAFDVYSGYYKTTDGQLYWSDTHQLANYQDDYHRRLDARLSPANRGTEMITEVYVRRDALVDFMYAVREDLRASRANVIYGTIRFIEKDDESFLPWAKERYACIIFNLHTAHDEEALRKTADDFRRLIDRAMEYGGSYYLTYHRWATRRQIEACYPQFVEFLKLKRKYDPDERFQSEWYRFYRGMFADAL